MSLSVKTLMEGFPLEELTAAVATLLTPPRVAAPKWPIVLDPKPRVAESRGKPKRAFAKRGIRTSRFSSKRYAAGPNSYRGRSGTWTSHMVHTVLDYRTVGEASQAHKASGLYPDKTLDFNWMVAQGFIRWED